jgi:hypothetical protein
MASLHNIPFDSRDRKLALAALFLNHNCEVCNLNVSLFRCPVSPEHEAVNEEPILTGLLDSGRQTRDKPRCGCASELPDHGEFLLSFLYL